MRRLRRIRLIVGAVLFAAVSVLPLSAVAAPNPYPSLAQIMLPAPSGYTAQTSSILSGSFNSHNLSSAWGAYAAGAQTALEQDGFVDGYGITVVNHTVHHAILEYIVAFAGGQGAMNWLAYAEAGDKADPTYQHSDSISGIGVYFGEHNVYPSGDVSDAFAFVKGNDFFVVHFVSTQDDVLNLAMSRTTSQYDSAPNSSIPTAQWPENANAAASPQVAPQDAGFALGGLIPVAIIAALLVGVILVVGGLVIRYRRRPEP